MTALAPLALVLALGQAAPPSPAPASPPAAVLTLDDALAQAQAQNWDLKQLDARLRQSQELHWKAWAGYLPQVTAGASYTYNQYETSIALPTGYAVRGRTGAANEPPADPAGLPGTATNQFITPTGAVQATIQKHDQLGGQIQLDQALIAPQLWYLIPAANHGERAASLSIESARRDVLFGVAQAFYGTASLRQAMQVSERLLEIARRQEHDANVRYQAGAIAKVGLLRAEIDRARAEQDLKRAQNSYESARIALATLLGRPVDFDIADPPQPELPADPASLEERALRERPDLLSARAQVDASRSNKNAQWARYLPTLGAFARWQVANVSGFSTSDNFYTLGLGLSWKIFDGGLRESDLRESRAKVAEAEAAAMSAELRVRQDVKQALLDLDSARANAAKAKEQRDLAAENQRLVDVAYAAGTATAVEQADATAQLRNAEIALTAESLGAQLAALRALKVAGAFHPTKG